MDYKTKIIEMVAGIEDEKFIKMIYGFVKRLFEQKKAER